MPAYFMFMARRPRLVPSCYLRVRLDCFKEKAVWIEWSAREVLGRGKKYGLLPKFFFCEFMDRDGVEVQKVAKKEQRQYPAILTEQARSIRDLL